MGSSRHQKELCFKLASSTRYLSAAPESSISNTPKKDTEDSGQRVERRTGNTLVMDYIKTESRLKIKYRDNPLVSDFAVSGVLKALRETGFEDPSSVVDADLLISYSKFTDLAWRTFSEHGIHSANEFSYSEIFRPQVTKLAAHYVTQPHEREHLVGIVAGGVYDYDEAMSELNKLSLV